MHHGSPSTRISARKERGFVEIPEKSKRRSCCTRRKLTYEISFRDSRSVAILALAVGYGHHWPYMTVWTLQPGANRLWLSRDIRESRRCSCCTKQDTHIRNRLLRLVQRRDFCPCRLARIKCSSELQICTAKGSSFSTIPVNQDRVCKAWKSVENYSAFYKNSELRQ